MEKPLFRLSPKALRDLHEIWSYIADSNEPAADALLKRIDQKIKRACRFPLMGSPRPDIAPELRILVEGHYLVLYEAESSGLLIVAVVHSSRSMDKWLESDEA